MSLLARSVSIANNSVDPLFAPLELGALHLRHRVVMAPLTRMRTTQPGDIPNGLMANYYRQRATPGGLIVSEATQVTPYGKGYPATPGIYKTEQVQGWCRVTDAVHSVGGLMVLQLWHVGRISHSSLLPGGVQPMAPSPVAAAGQATRADGTNVPFETPRALDLDELPHVIEQFRRGAENAKDAGFDGVEIHSANGYLLDQFLQDGTNRRTDAYGGSVANRARLLLEVTEAVGSVWSADRVGVRLSPYGTFNDMHDSNPLPLFTHVIRELSNRRIAYLHLVEPRSSDASSPEQAASNAPDAAKLFRSSFAGKLIGAGGFTAESARDAVVAGSADAVAFGRLFISNPDLPARIRQNAQLNPYDRSTFYGGTERGYIDYPMLGSSNLELTSKGAGYEA